MKDLAQQDLVSLFVLSLGGPGKDENGNAGTKEGVKSGDIGPPVLRGRTFQFVPAGQSRFLLRFASFFLHGVLQAFSSLLSVEPSFFAPFCKVPASLFDLVLQIVPCVFITGPAPGIVGGARDCLLKIVPKTSINLRKTKLIIDILSEKICKTSSPCSGNLSLFNKNKYLFFVKALPGWQWQGGRWR